MFLVLSSVLIQVVEALELLWLRTMALLLGRCVTKFRATSIGECCISVRCTLGLGL